MPEIRAGILLHRKKFGVLQVFLAHPGGPYWARKDDGAWTIPKGLIGPSEDELAAAQREFLEETGFRLTGAFHELGVFRQPSGKRIHVWALRGDCDLARLVSNTFAMEWPPKSGQTKEFPEIDRAGWFDERDAFTKIVVGQRPILEAFFGTFR